MTSDFLEDINYLVGKNLILNLAKYNNLNEKDTEELIRKFLLRKCIIVNKKLIIG